MKKCKFIIGKRQIMISTLILILAAAAYLNWIASNDQAITVMDKMSNIKKSDSVIDSDSDSTDFNDAESNYGDAQLVSNQSTTDYFDQSKIQKEKSTSDYAEQLDSIIGSANVPEEKKKEAANQRLILNNIQNQEHAIEAQIKALGYTDCLAQISNKTDINSNPDNTPIKNETANDKGKETNNVFVNVTVKAKDMTEAQAAKIKDIIVNITNATSDKIVITPVETD